MHDFQDYFLGDDVDGVCHAHLASVLYLPWNSILFLVLATIERWHGRQLLYVGDAEWVCGVIIVCYIRAQEITPCVGSCSWSMISTIRWLFHPLSAWHNHMALCGLSALTMVLIKYEELDQCIRSSYYIYYPKLFSDQICSIKSQYRSRGLTPLLSFSVHTHIMMLSHDTVFFFLLCDVLICLKVWFSCSQHMALPLGRCVCILSVLYFRPGEYELYQGCVCPHYVRVFTAYCPTPTHGPPVPSVWALPVRRGPVRSGHSRTKTNRGPCSFPTWKRRQLQTRWASTTINQTHPLLKLTQIEHTHSAQIREYHKLALSIALTMEAKNF